MFLLFGNSMLKFQNNRQESIRGKEQQGILADFLQAQRAEVVAMSIFEYNEEEEMKKSVLQNMNMVGKWGMGKASRQERNLELLDSWLKRAAKAKN